MRAQIIVAANAEPRRRGQRGFSLVELMVGITIAMVVVLVILTVFSNFEEQKRQTTLSSDTQTSGAMAIFELEQAIRSAGAGVVSEDSFDCTPATTKSYYTRTGSSAVTVSPAPFFGNFMAPVVITNGASNASDTLEVRAGAPLVNAAPTELLSGDALLNTSTQIRVKRAEGFPVGTVLLVAQSGKCVVVEVTGLPDSNEKRVLSISPAASGNTWNPTPTYKAANNWPEFGPTVANPAAAAAGTYVYAVGNLSRPATLRTYSVNASNQLQVVNSQLTVADSTESLVGDVVSLQAQYGVSSAVGTQDIWHWVEPVAGGANGDWGPANLDASKVKRIKAIRLAIVVRSPKMEATNVTSTCTNNAGANNGPCAWEDTSADKAPLIDLSGDANWRRYRYRVFQTVIPLRNNISAGV